MGPTTTARIATGLCNSGLQTRWSPTALAVQAEDLGVQTGDAGVQVLGASAGVEILNGDRGREEAWVVRQFLQALIYVLNGELG